MNKNLHKIIFSRNRNAYVVVSETASSISSASKASSSSHLVLAHSAVVLATSLSFSFILMASAFAAPALPQGGVVAQGQVAVTQAGDVMTVNQSSDKAILNWQSFNVGTGASVNIVQPGASSTHLSRVTGNDPSVIQGQLNSNGQVVLVNPNGIVVGKDGSVSASSFTASTLNITDADFMAGKYQYARNGANGEVVNQGKIQTKAGGYVALIGAKVTNEGTITSQQGAVYLGAGDAVAVPVTGSGRIKFEVSPAAINTSVSNNKDAVIVAEGGQVYMRAASLNDLAVASVQQSGLVDVSGAQGGNVTVLADKGHIKVDGTVRANSTVAAKGGNVVMGRDMETGVLAAAGDYAGAKLEADKGFVETSGDWIATTGTFVKAGEWLLDPANITISAGPASGTAYVPAYEAGADSVILATDIANSLNAGTSVTISTGTTNANGASDGNINVTSAIVKSGVNTAKLTLNANNSITVRARIGKAAGDTTSTGKLDIEMTADGKAFNTLNSRGIILRDVLDANGGIVNLTGTSYNTAGNAFPTSWGNINNQNSGVVFYGGSGINAGTYTVKGEVKAPLSMGTSGVAFINDANKEIKFNSSAGESKIHGISDAIGNFGSGLIFADNAKVTIDTTLGTNTATAVFSGEHSTAVTGLRIGNWGSINSQLNTKGRVTLASQNFSGDEVSRKRLTFRGGNVNVQANSVLNMLGESIDFYDFAAHLYAQSGTVVNLNAKNNILFSKAWAGGNFKSEGQVNITSSNGGIESYRDISAAELNLVSKSLLVNNDVHVKGKLAISTPDITNIRLGESVEDLSILEISQAELNKFKAAELLIGNAAINNTISLASNIQSSIDIQALTLQTAGTIAFAGKNLTVGNLLAPKLNRLTLNSSTTSNAKTIKSNGLELLGTAEYSLRDTNSQFGMIAGSVGSADIFHTGALTVGSVGTSTGLKATGTIKLESNAGISVTEKIESLYAGASAIYLNAGKSAAAGTAAGGDIVFSGNGQVIAPTSATVMLYTGSVAGSLGLGILPGNSRYNSDEQLPTNFTKPISTPGKYAIYREQPVLNVTFKDQTKTYDGTTYSGHNGFQVLGLKNGDTEAVIQNIVISGSSQDAKNVGTYVIAGSGQNDVGYGMKFFNGSLKIDPKLLTTSVFADNKIYDGNSVATGTVVLNGLVNGESLTTSYGYMTFDNKNAGINKTVTANAISIATNGTSLASNYALMPDAQLATGLATIYKKAINLNVSGASIQDKAYDTTTAAAFNVAPVLEGAVSGDAVAVTATARFSDPNAGKNKLVSLFNTNLVGADALNYELVTPDSLIGNINKARISVVINSATTNAGSIVPLTYTVNGLVNGQTASSVGITLFNLRADGYSVSSLNAGSYIILADGLYAQNYELAGVNAITPGVLTVLASIDSTDTTRSSPEFTGTRPSALSASDTRASVVIGGIIQGGEFSLASAEDCKTESCFCETSDFDRDVELCYEEDVRVNRPPVRRSQVTL